MESAKYPAKQESSLPDLSPEQQTQIRAHLASILSSAPFLSSQRSRSFLKYVVEESLDGRSAHIKERNIAVDVFGKRIDFDPQEESTVRVAAGEVRKRLSQAYEISIQGSVRIELPVGSYCPRFILREPETEPKPAAEAPAPVVIKERPPRIQLRSHWIWAPVCVLLAVVATAVWFASKRTEAPIDRIWNVFSGYKQPVLLVLPTPSVLVAIHPEMSLRTSADLRAQSGSYTGVGAGLGAARFAEQLAKRNQPFTLRVDKNLSYQDVEQSPSILFGGVTSAIGMQMTSSLRFRVVEGAQETRIIDAGDLSHAWVLPKNLPIDAQQEGYALITLIRNTESGYPLLIIAGLSPADTQAGAQFATDSESLKAFARVAGKRWADQNFQLVLHEHIYAGTPGRSTVASWHCW